MITAIIIDIPDELFKDNLSAKFNLIHYPNGEMKHVGISGKQRLIKLPEKKEKPKDSSYDFGFAKEIDGYNKCLDEILGGETW